MWDIFVHFGEVCQRREAELSMLKIKVTNCIKLPSGVHGVFVDWHRLPLENIHCCIWKCRIQLKLFHMAKGCWFQEAFLSVSGCCSSFWREEKTDRSVFGSMWLSPLLTLFSQAEKLLQRALRGLEEQLDTSHLHTLLAVAQLSALQIFSKW